MCFVKANSKGQRFAALPSLSFFNYNVLDWTSGNADAYAAVMAAYAQSKDVRGGALYTYENGKVATFARVSGEHALIVMVNTSKNAATAKTPISMAGSTVTDLIAGSSETLPVSVELDGYGYRVWMK